MKEPVFKAILKYKNHPIILAIRHRTRDTGKNSILFKDVTIAEIEKEIKKLSSENASHNGGIPTRTVKEDADIFVDVLCKSINATFKSSMFPNSLKLADVTLLHKKAEKT